MTAPGPNPVRALEDAQKAAQLRPFDAEVLDTQAHILEILDRRAEAISCYRTALRLNPDIEGSKEGLRRLGATP
jgi:Flp pilus assembly protein TadD